MSKETIVTNEDNHISNQNSNPNSFEIDSKLEKLNKDLKDQKNGIRFLKLWKKFQLFFIPSSILLAFIFGGLFSKGNFLAYGSFYAIQVSLVLIPYGIIIGIYSEIMKPIIKKK